MNFSPLLTFFLHLITKLKFFSLGFKILQQAKIISFSSSYTVLSFFFDQFITFLFAFQHTKTNEIINFYPFFIFLFFLNISHSSLPKRNMLSVYREAKSKHRLRGLGFSSGTENTFHALVYSFYFSVLPYWHSDIIMLVLMRTRYILSS